MLMIITVNMEMKMNIMQVAIDNQTKMIMNTRMASIKIVKIMKRKIMGMKRNKIMTTIMKMTIMVMMIMTMMMMMMIILIMMMMMMMNMTMNKVNKRMTIQINKKKGNLKRKKKIKATKILFLMQTFIAPKKRKKNRKMKKNKIASLLCRLLEQMKINTFK